MKKYFVETEHYVAPCEFDSQDQFEKFLKICKEECEDINAHIRERKEIEGFSGYEEHLTFEYRDAFGKTDDDLRQDIQREAYEEYTNSCIVLVQTKIYPASVLKDAPAHFIDKQANWNNRQNDGSGDGHDINRMQKFLNRVAQIRKNKKEEVTSKPPEHPVDVVDNHRMTQALTGVGVPDTIYSYQADIEDSDGTLVNVHDEKVLQAIEKQTKELTAAINNNTRNQERAAFNGTFRAQARFADGTEFVETDIEMVHRLRSDKMPWNSIGREVYRKAENKEILEEYLPTYVNALQQKYKRAYPDPIKK